MNSPITLTVSQLNEYIAAILGSSEFLHDIYIKGEISNFTNHYKSGHFYFTVKDENAALKAVMFRSNACRIPFVPENGMKITAHGRVAVYERDGVYQLYCDELIPDGIGSLYLAYEQLKAKLNAEGLFDDEAKKPIPRYPQSIGIITAKTGAAIADLTNILTRRYPICEIKLFPALVQGKGAAESLINGIKYFDGKVDTIIIGRGGGSIEDLWAFNDERLARAIYACSTPVISAVGHEVDFTICDFVSDLRAPTPSAAAELAVPDMTDLKISLQNFEKRFDICLGNLLNQRKERIRAISESSVFKSPEAYFDRKRTDLMNIELRFSSASERMLEAKKNNLAKISASLCALNPLSVLSRGYSAVYSGSGEVVSSIEQVSPGESITLELSDGRLTADVTGKERHKRN